MIPLRAAVAAMAYRGFRVGALPGLVVHNRRFVTASKGKAWQGELPPRVVRSLLRLGKQPFAAVKTGTIQTAFKRLTRRLAAAGVIAHAYSVHDLRHFYATSEYRRDRDLVRVSRLLNHADVKVTTKYLHDLGAMEERHANSG
jgi:integrase